MNSIHFAATSAVAMPAEELEKNFPPGIYRVQWPVMLRGQVSVKSTPVCKLRKDQLVTVDKVSPYVQEGKRSVRARITSPYVGWTSLISTNMRRCLILECTGDSPELLELAERARIKTMSKSKRQHTGVSLKKWHQREREARRLAKEGDRRAAAANQADFEHERAQHEDPSRWAGPPERPTYPPRHRPAHISMQRNRQMGRPGNEAMVDPSQEQMSCAWDQLDENEMPFMLGQPSMPPSMLYQPMYQQPVMYQTQQPAAPYQYAEAQYAMMPMHGAQPDQSGLYASYPTQDNINYELESQQLYFTSNIAQY